MPTEKRSCAKPGCGKPLPCPRHTRTRFDQQNRAYGRARHRNRFRAGVLAGDPPCALCGRPATVADHWPRSRRQLVTLGLDPDNPIYGRPLCWSCHSRETNRNQPGGYLAPH